MTGAAGPDDALPAIAIEGVSKRFGRTLALDDLSLSIRPNEMFALLGPNGAGKTTLFRILTTVLSPDSGKVRIFGHDVRRNSLKARAELGVVFQESSLDGKLTVEENLDFHGRMYRMSRSQRRQRIAEMLEMVELSQHRGKLVRSLSPGMKRRLELARALLHDSRVLILDEPTVGLDAQSRERIWSYLETIRRERGITIVVTTHYIDEVENCDRICVVDSGRILAVGTPDELRKSHDWDVLVIEPASPEAARRIEALFPGAVVVNGSTIRVIDFDPERLITLLKDFSADIRSFSVERPTLNSVFLALTGRDLRES